MDPIAQDLLNAWDGSRLTERPCLLDPTLDLARAYRLAAQQRSARMARGEMPVGWKIGFTNRRIWNKYQVHAPIWGTVWAGGLQVLPDAEGECALRGLVQQRIEPELVVRFARAPDAAMDELELLACLDWVAHGIEIVHTHYADWLFEAPDTVLDFGLHGRLLVGPVQPVSAFTDPVRDLAAWELTLHGDGHARDRGRGAHVLDGPIAALRHWLRAMDALQQDDAGGPWRVQAGDIVTTGTVTDAWPVAPGQIWTTHSSHPLLPGLKVAFTLD